MAAPPPGHEGAARCMVVALQDAGILPSEIDYINAHGTSTQLNDLYETQAIKKVFGDHSRNLAVSSTKSMTGHLLGAAGGIEAIFVAKSIYETSFRRPLISIIQAPSVTLTMSRTQPDKHPSAT